MTAENKLNNRDPKKDADPANPDTGTESDRIESNFVNGPASGYLKRWGGGILTVFSAAAAVKRPEFCSLAIVGFIIYIAGEKAAKKDAQVTKRTLIKAGSQIAQLTRALEAQKKNNPPQEL